MYEPPGSTVTYSVPHTYHPDFVHPQQPDILVEVKGWFIKGSSDAQKYIAIARDNPNKEIVFIFSNPEKKAYAGLRPRADGTVMTLREWAFRNRFLHYTVDNFPQALYRGAWSIEDIRAYKREIFG